MSTFVLPLADPNATLENVGGKGMSLAKMARAGLSVPDGFHVTTDASGVLFTANPVNGKRDEIVINAAWGLGDAIVSGAVTPDRIVRRKK